VTISDIQWPSVVISGPHLERHVGHSRTQLLEAFPWALVKEAHRHVKGRSCGEVERRRRERLHAGPSRPSEAHLPTSRGWSNQSVISGHQRHTSPHLEAEAAVKRLRGIRCTTKKILGAHARGQQRLVRVTPRGIGEQQTLVLAYLMKGAIRAQSESDLNQTSIRPQSESDPNQSPIRAQSEPNQTRRASPHPLRIALRPLLEQHRAPTSFRKVGRIWVGGRRRRLGRGRCEHVRRDLVQRRRVRAECGRVAVDREIGEIAHQLFDKPNALHVDLRTVCKVPSRGRDREEIWVLVNERRRHLPRSEGERAPP